MDKQKYSEKNESKIKISTQSVDECKAPPELSISLVGSTNTRIAIETDEQHFSDQPKIENGKPQSLSALSVNTGVNYSHMASILSISRHNSQASSINDINYETEQLLEKAIRHNDVKLVSKIFEHYYSDDDGKNESLDKTNLTAKKSLSLSKDEKIERPVLKTQSAIDEQNYFHGLSSSIEDGDNSYLFSTALHLAIENNAYDVFLFLLKHRIDPNNPGKTCYQTECFRPSRNTSVDSQDHLPYSNFENIPSTSCEPLIRSPSIRSANLPLLLNPNIVNTPKIPSIQSIQSNQYSISSEPYNLNSRRSSTKSAKIIQIRSEISTDKKTVHVCSDGTRITYDEEYNREKLFTLPPIFLAVALNNSIILRELIAYGANVNLMDGHGVTPLHLCLCQQHISRSCLQLLIHSGAKLKTKNNKNVAPIDLVDETFAHEIIQMQTAIIDESFEQLLLRSTTDSRRDSVPFIKHRKHSKTIPIKAVNNLAFFKENSTDSYTNGTNLAKFFETKIMNNEIKRKNFPFTIKQSSKDATTLSQEDKSPTENVPPKNVQKKSITNSATSNSTLFLPTSPGSIGHKRSFAIDSQSDKTSALKSLQNLSQSTLQLSGNNNNDNNQPQTSTNHHPHSHTSFGARYLFGRRRSGEDNAKNQLKIARTLLSRTTTQDENKNNEKINTKRLQDAIETLYKMASNIECIPKIICCLQKYLPEIVSMNEQQNILSILHDSFSKLLQKALQTIIENFSMEKKKIFYNKQNHPNRNFDPCGTHYEQINYTNEIEIIRIVRLKQQLASQLCDLIDCAFHCLKSGQTFQYTSLLIINKIIDAFVRYETFDSQLDFEQIYEHNVQSREKESKKSTSIFSHEEPMENDNKHTSAALQFSKHIKHLRLHESFRIGQKNPSNNDKKHDKSHPIELEIEKDFIEQSSSSSSSNVIQNFETKKLMFWVKNVYRSPKVEQKQKRFRIISEKFKTVPTKTTTTANASDDTNFQQYLNRKNNNKIHSTNNNEKERYLDDNTVKSFNVQTFITILSHKGLDLLLNVLNNAITLHKRFSESKQLCIPSKRCRNCLYHCLQILSARAILYTSQNDDAQKRLIEEGPFKVLISSIDSTNDPQLICLTLQTIANISINPNNHQRLIDANIADTLMQLILPSDEWFYTNHSTKYAKFVKHQAARIMVYLGLEKRLRNKVYLFDLMDDLSWHSPSNNSAEDSYIIQTSIAPSVVFSGTTPPILIGCSVENIVVDLIKKIEDKLINGEDSLCLDPLNDETMNCFIDGMTNNSMKDTCPPAIQVDMPSGLITNHHFTNYPNCFFYLSTLPMTLQPIILLRVLQHRMFGAISYWTLQSRASVASSAASSYECYRSRTNSNASNCNFPNLKQNIDWHCSNSSLSPGRIDFERRMSAKGLTDNYRLTPQNSFPLGTKCSMSDCLSTTSRNNSITTAHRLSIQRSSIQPVSLIEQQSHVNELDTLFLQQHKQVNKNHHTFSIDGANSNPNNSIDNSDAEEAYIISFQRELQNLPKSPVLCENLNQNSTVNDPVANIARETFENVGNQFIRPRSRSVPRITLENFPTVLLHLPKNPIIQTQQQQEKNNQLPSSTSSSSRMSAYCKSSQNAAIDNRSNNQIFNFNQTSPNLSPLKHSFKNLSESPNSCGCSSHRTVSTKTGSRSGSTGQVINEWIMPNIHKAIMKLIIDWINICPDDFQQSAFRREFIEFLNRVSAMGEQYRWFCEEIRYQAIINESETLTETPSMDEQINKDYERLQKLILSGQLPCSKEEAVTLAVIQLRIDETSPPTNKATVIDNESDHHHHHHPHEDIIAQSSSSMLNKSTSVLGEKLRPISENVKENLSGKLFRGTPTTTITKTGTTAVQSSSSAMSSSFDENDEEEDNHKILSNTTANKTNDSIFKFNQINRIQYNNANNNSSSSNSSNILQTFSTKTANRILQWMSANWNDTDYNFSSIDARRYLPPIYQSSKNIAKTIREQKRKLFHTSVYESEQQLKKLYIQTCKRLPAYGCQLFQVKELLHGRTNRRATRLLGICLERIVLLDCNTLQLAKAQPTNNLQQWRTGGGRSHDRLVLEFRGTQWSFITSSHNSLRAIGTVLWEILQSVDSSFLDALIANESRYCSKNNINKDNSKLNNNNNSMAIDNGNVSDSKQKRRFRDELLGLESILHFPEEVALCLAQVEYDLFYNIQPVHYIRQVTLDLSTRISSTGEDDESQQNKQSDDNVRTAFTVEDLIERFHEVSSWITQLIISQPTHEMRKAFLSSIMRVVQTCWNLGNFNSAVEILAGLKSEKLKPFWLSIEQKDDLHLFNELSKILLTLNEPSDEYKIAVIKALDIPHSQVIPFFGAFLHDLKNILKRVPSLIVLSNENANIYRDSIESSQNHQPRIETISDFNGDNNYMSRIGVGGIINMEKMYKAHQVMDNLRTFHVHSIRRNQLLSTINQTSDERAMLGIITSETQCDNINNSQEDDTSCHIKLNATIEKNSADSKSLIRKENEDLYQIDVDYYKPIQSMRRTHGISFIPFDPQMIDYHVLQVMHHGTTIIHYEEDSGRSSVVYLKLEQSNSMIVWCKPFWSTTFRSSNNTPQDYQLSYDIEDFILPGISLKYETKEPALIGLEEGFLDLMYLKDVFIRSASADLPMIGRRHGFIDSIFADPNNNYSIKLLFGQNLSDNRTTEFIAPKMTLSIWTEGLRSILKLLQNQKRLTDQRISWLKEKYLQAYYEESVCKGPTPAEAIRMFGGRKWTIDTMGSSYQSLQTDSSMNRFNNMNKNRKKKTGTSFSVNRELSNRSQLSINSSPDTFLNHCRSDHSTPTHHFKSSNLSTQIHAESDQNMNNSQSSFDDNFVTSDTIPIRCNTLASNYHPSQIHTTQLTSEYREKYCKRNFSTFLDSFSASLKVTQKMRTTSATTNGNVENRSVITHSANLSFSEYSQLFRSFYICIRRDIKDIFEQIATKSDIYAIKEIESNSSRKESLAENSQEISRDDKKGKFIGLLTRNNSDIHSTSDYKNRIFDAISAASIVTNSAGIDSLNTSILTANDFHSFLTTYQSESSTIDDAKNLIEMHEPNVLLRKRHCFSFEGFACYLMDKDNFAYTPELIQTNEEDMNYPLSHYYCATSHNTYLTGHQLKGESSVELYSQVLLTGCRCVELDCWDGDDGMPVIYHGHTLTSKIPFKKVVETINEKAFVASPYPVILSVENHCSLQQQARMAQIFMLVFGEKLVTKFLFESDYVDDPRLPSPNHLKYRILIKNKKLRAPILHLANQRMRVSLAHSKSINDRANSLVSNTSTGSFNDDEDDDYDDEDDDEDVEELLPISFLTSIETSPEKRNVSNEKDTPKSQRQVRSNRSDSSHNECDNNIFNSPLHNKSARKSSSQIAPELSDLVIYCQAIKFHGLRSEQNASLSVSPTNSTMATPVSKKITSRKLMSTNTMNVNIQSNQNLLSVSDSIKLKDDFSRELNNLSPTYQSANTNWGLNKRPNSTAPCYQVASINENTAKKLCRKNPLTVISHTESQIMRTYPTGMRIDSSNFNPVIFWAFGIQNVALNYQTVDTALQINSAMFEQNGGCGYVLKSRVMRDKSHMMYGRFNPWDKEFDGLHTINLTITIISGQYVCPNTNTGSPQVEVETIGIPIDCNRQRTKIVQRNSLNPIWNDTFRFRVKFVDLVFLRITVTDVTMNQMVAQITLPMKCLRQGYRHLRLRNVLNQNLPLSTLFIYSSYEEEGLDIQSDTSLDQLSKNNKLSKIDLNKLDSTKIEPISTSSVKRRMFFLVVHGVIPEESSTILKITQDSTVNDVISQALSKANKPNESVNDYVLLEEVDKGWEKTRPSDRSGLTQRILDPNERPLEAQNNWKGDGKFILKRLADDPSTRAWMTTIRSASAHKENSHSSEKEISGDWEDNKRDENETFLVCIYNVSKDQPYTILKSLVNSTAQDIIQQALHKAHRNEDSKKFVLVEEIENFIDTQTSEQKSNKNCVSYRRVLDDDENIYNVQTQWKNKGKFELKYHSDITANDNTVMKMSSSLLRQNPRYSIQMNTRDSLKKLSRIHRTYSKRFQRKESDDSLQRSTIINQERSSMITTNPNIIANMNDQSRQVHSDGELSSDIDERITGISGGNLNETNISSFSRLKRLSMKRLKQLGNISK